MRGAPQKRSGAAEDFADIVRLIEASRGQAIRAVNSALIELYWRVGEVLSRRIAAGEWGDAVVPRLAAHIAQAHPGVRGFTRPNLFRMKRFYEAYTESPIVSALPRQLTGNPESPSASLDAIVSALPTQLGAPSPAVMPPLLTQLPWTHHLILLGQSKQPQEREFYLQRATRERWSSRELERQIRSAAFERTLLSDKKLAPAMRVLPQDATGIFKDSYLLDFLDLPQRHSEADPNPHCCAIFASSSWSWATALPSSARRCACRSAIRTSSSISSSSIATCNVPSPSS